MSDAPQDFDLKFLPDWLKEAPAPNRYADYEGDTGDRPRRDRDDRRGPPRGDRPPERRGPRPPQGDRPQGPRPQRAPGGDRPRGNRPGPGGPRPAPAGGERRGPQRSFDRRDEHRAPRQPAPSAPAPLQIEFLPEPNAAVGIAKQIRSTGRAYAVFQTAKLFLERPERHRVRITSTKPEVLLYQAGDGPLTFDRALAERGAFQHARSEYDVEETVQGEPIKGNFSNVARCRSTGTLLGPTNHHGYQPALRKLYEERFQRRMSFQQFQQEIEIVSDQQSVADWKEQARSATTFQTIKEAEPLTFKSEAEAAEHFRTTYLPQLIKSGISLECSGTASRAPLDRFVSASVRAAWEDERAFPQGLVNALRPYFSEAGLHFFKHRKRVLHVSAMKPLRHPEGQQFSDSIQGILAAVETSPRIKRPDLATKILGQGHDAPELASRKSQLAADLLYLLQIGHVIEFADGSLELPLSAKAEKPSPSRGNARPTGSTEKQSHPTEAEEDPGEDEAEEIDEAPQPSVPAAPTEPTEPTEPTHATKADPPIELGSSTQSAPPTQS